MKVLINERFFPNELIYHSSITDSLDMCILKRNFSRLIFSFKKFKRWGQNLYFWVSKIALQLVIPQYLKNYLTKIVHWPHYGIIIASCKCWENKNGQIYRNQDTEGQFFQIIVMPKISWNRYNSTLRCLLDVSETSLNVKCRIEGFSSFQSVLAHDLG